MMANEAIKIKDRKMTIGFLIHRISGKGGTERVTIQIANGLSRNGYEVCIISCREGDHANYDVADGVKLLSLEGEKCSNPIIRKLKTASTLKEIVKKRKISIMIAVDVMLYPYIYYLQKRHLCKGVAWEHFNYFGKEMFGTHIRNHAARNADALIVLSEHDKKNYEKNCKRIKNIVHIYNPVSNKAFETIYTKEKMVLSVGRLEDQKGYDMLLKAWKDVEKKCPEWELVIVGSGGKEAVLRQIIEDNKIQNVSIEPFTNDIGSYYSKAQLYVMSSRYEGFPLVLIEAQAAGLPIISFDCKEGPSEIIREGVNGYLIPEGNLDKLTSQITRVLDDDKLRFELSNHAKDDLDRYNEDAVIDIWIPLLRNMGR